MRWTHPYWRAGDRLRTAPPARRVHCAGRRSRRRSSPSFSVALVVTYRGADDDVAAPTDSTATTLSPTITTTEPAPTTSTSSSTTVGASRPLGGDAASCVEEYNLATLAGHTWGFDGTVQSIAPLVEDGVDTTVEFDVHEWFGSRDRQRSPSTWLPHRSTHRSSLLTTASAHGCW